MSSAKGVVDKYSATVNFGTHSRIWPPWTAHSRVAGKTKAPDRNFRAGQGRLTWVLREWGGWGSNPRPEDYESPALTG
jgi:hypothetical protein